LSDFYMYVSRRGFFDEFDSPTPLDGGVSQTILLSDFALYLHQNQPPKSMQRKTVAWSNTRHAFEKFFSDAAGQYGSSYNFLSWDSRTRADFMSSFLQYISTEGREGERKHFEKLLHTRDLVKGDLINTNRLRKLINKCYALPVTQFDLVPDD